MHDMYAEFNSAYKSCIIGPREVHSEAVSGHFLIYVGLGVYGHGPCLQSTFQAQSRAIPKHFVLHGVWWDGGIWGMG